MQLKLLRDQWMLNEPESERDVYSVAIRGFFDVVFPHHSLINASECIPKRIISKLGFHRLINP